MTITVTPLSTPPSRDDPANFRTRADNFLGELPGLVLEVNLQNVENNQINANVNTQVATAVNAAQDAAVHAASAAATSTAANWVSGTTYVVGNIRRSLIDGLPYVRLTNGSGTTDPRSDRVNWALDFFQQDTGLPTIRPNFNLDPCNSGMIDTRITTTRGVTATYWDSLGSIQTAPINKLRIDHDPVTGECLGYLVENTATNLLLNSLINGTALTTQSVSVSATQMCISFYGTGTIVLSGAHSATIAGIGASPTRTFLAFTPSAGTLTVTVTGDVKYAQLETGVTRPTSFIPTAGTAVTRLAETAVISAFSTIYNQTEGTLVIEFEFNSRAGNNTVYANINTGSSSPPGFTISNAEASQVLTISLGDDGLLTKSSFNNGDKVRVAASYKVGEFAAAVNGEYLGADTSFSGSYSLTALNIGSSLSGQGANTHISSIRYYPKASSTAQLQALSRI